MKRRDLYKESMWRKYISRWESSDITARSFCDQHGLSEGSFHHWKREIAKRDQVNENSSKHQQSDSSMEFTEIQLSDDYVSSDVIEVAYSSGVSIRLRSAFDRNALRRVLEVLSEVAEC